jgi:AcrR family transcriptional regulator
MSDTARRYGGKTLQERRNERRERLLDAGLELFGTQGYAQTTIEQLCAAARLNPRYFYEEFATREALLGAVYDRHVTAVAGDVVAAIEAAPPEPLARLRAGLEAFLEGTLADERAARINYFEVVGVSPELERLRRDALGAYADLIAGQMAELNRTAPIPVHDRRLAAVAIVGATDGLIIDWLAGARAYDRGAILATLLDVFGPLLAG